jgi:acetate kinase
MKSHEVYDLLAKGIVEMIGLESARLQHTSSGKAKVVKDLPIPDHRVGMQVALEALIDKEHGVLQSFEDIEAVGHRIVHGADFFAGSVLVDEEVLSKIEFCNDFAPLHNPAHLLGIRACQEVLPSVPQVVTFDTAFHQTMPPYAYMYALPYRCYEKYHIRRYGAHGTSHQFVANKGAKMVGLDIADSKIVTCHIGNGSSITATVNGRSIDTSMGLTPLEGLIMGTRCGDVDANAILYLMRKEDMTVDQMYRLVNKESGFLGLSEKTSDAREMDELANAGDPKAKLVFKMLTFQMIKYIGAYAAAMNGLDAVFFTGGIGEHNSRLRRRVCENFSYLGLKLDYEANTASGVDTVISLPDSQVRVALVTTDEELVIARDTMQIVQNLNE